MLSILYLITYNFFLPINIFKIVYVQKSMVINYIVNSQVSEIIYNILSLYENSLDFRVYA